MVSGKVYRSGAWSYKRTPGGFARYADRMRARNIQKWRSMKRRSRPRSVMSYMPPGMRSVFKRRQRFGCRSFIKSA